MSRYRKKNRVKPTKDLMWALYDNCFWCEEYVPYENATVEHLIPTSYNGPDSLQNTYLCCDDCNHKRGNDMSPILMSKIMEHFGWMYAPLYEVCPEIHEVRYELSLIRDPSMGPCYAPKALTH